MRKKRSGLQTSILQWTYQSRKNQGRAAGVLKSLEEVEKTLEDVKIKKK